MAIFIYNGPAASEDVYTERFQESLKAKAHINGGAIKTREWSPRMTDIDFQLNPVIAPVSIAL